MSDKKKPKFKRRKSGMVKRVKMRYRKPKGEDNPQRQGKRGLPKTPNPGYGSSKKTRGLHPSGLEEVLISNKKDLERLEKGKTIARFSSKLGKKKRREFQKEIEKMKIKIANPLREEKEKPKKEADKK
jgi:large subunit ribosomal protein L32e